MARWLGQSISKTTEAKRLKASFAECSKYAVAISYQKWFKKVTGSWVPKPRWLLWHWKKPTKERLYWGFTNNPVSVHRIMRVYTKCLKKCNQYKWYLKNGSCESEEIVACLQLLHYWCTQSHCLWQVGYLFQSKRLLLLYLAITNNQLTLLYI